MSSNVARSKSAPTTKPLSTHFLPKTVSFSALEVPSRPAVRSQPSEVERPSIFDPPTELYRSPMESPLAQRVEAFNLSGGFFPTQAHEYEWVSLDDELHEDADRVRTSKLSLGALPSPQSPVSTSSSLPATPGANLGRHPLPDELDYMASEAIKSEDKMGVLKITSRGLSSLLLGAGSDKPQPEFAAEADPLTEETLYSAIRARRLEATAPRDEQAHYGELFFGSQPGQAIERPHGWSGYLGRFI